MVTLRHLNLPGLTSYAHVSRIQDLLVAQFLGHKALTSKLRSSIPTTDQNAAQQPPPSPQPTIITFTPHPIYTTGRREKKPSAQQLQVLQQPLSTQTHGLLVAEYAHALRGGQITFHGPGQLVIYPILSLSHPGSFPPSPLSKFPHPLTPRCYINLLESCTISTIADYGISGIRTENPGVWVDDNTKIAALGVHLRRNVTSHGVGLNMTTDLRWYERIVACGLEGKGVTSVEQELQKRGLRSALDLGASAEAQEDEVITKAAKQWVGHFARGMGLAERDVERVAEWDIVEELEEAIDTQVDRTKLGRIIEDIQDHTKG